MKKLVLCLAGAMMALSLAACSPTKVEEADKPQAAQVNPEGLTPEMVQQQRETQVDPKLQAPDPNAPVLDSAMVYYGKDSGDGLMTEMVDVEELNAQAVVDALIEHSILDDGTTVNSFDIEGGEKAGPGVDASAVGDGERTGILDLTQMDPDADKIVLYAVANSFCDSFELDRLEILVNGEAYENSEIADGYLYYLDNFEKIN